MNLKNYKNILIKMEQVELTKTKKSNKEIIFTILRQKSYLKLFKKYSSSNYSFNSICINNIIYNEPCLIVAKFKDYLIYDDNTEFIRKFYNNSETKHKLNRILDLYENYSKIFPNYLVIKEKKFMYKNIRRKQKMIDAFNQIKLEEEENRKKIKEQKDENKEDNRLFTDTVKNEIKIFQKDNNSKPYKNSFDSQSEKDEDTDTLFGRSHSSISINLLNKKELNKGFSFDSKNNETNGTLSGILNIMNDNKIYIKDLTDIFKEKTNPNYIIEKKIISFKKKKNNTHSHKMPKLSDNKSTNNINNNLNNNNIILQKIILTPKKDEKKIILGKNHFHFNSTVLSKKRIKMLNPSLINTNSNKHSVQKEKKNCPQKQNIYIPSTGNTIININNNFFQEVSKTERCEPPKLKKILNVNNHKYKTLQNTSREKDEKNKKNDINININTNNTNSLSSNHKNPTKNNFSYIKCKHISHDFSYKKNTATSTVTEFNNKTTNKIYNNFINKTKRELSPQLVLNVRKKKKYLKSNNDTNNSNNTNNIKVNNNNDTIKNAIIKLYKQKSKEKNKNIFSKYNSNNKKQIISYLKNSKYNYNEYSSFSFLKTAKTESNVNSKNLSQKSKNQKMEKFKEKQKTCFNFVKNNNNFKINKDMFLQDKYLINNKKSNKTEKKSKNSNKKINDIITKKHIENKSHKSRDKNKNIIVNNSIKSKILKSEVKIQPKYFISNYTNKMNTNYGEKINTFIEYTSISGKNVSKENLTNFKSLDKKKKCESIDFSSRENHNKKNVFKKIDSIKRNSYIYSPKNSLSNFLKNKNKNNNKNNGNKIINDYFTDRQSSYNQTTMPMQHTCNTSQNNMRSKYKAILLTKNNKKSYDFNSDIQKKYKQNILNTINNPNKNIYLSIFRKGPESNSIDFNSFNYNNNKYCSNTYRNPSKDKDKEEDNKDLFKKIMSFKMNKNKMKYKNEEKMAKSNKGNEKKNINMNLNLPMTIKVNTSNFLSKIKSKNKNNNNNMNIYEKKLKK